jgi:hypothetical protein
MMSVTPKKEMLRNENQTDGAEMSMGRSISWPDGWLNTYKYCDSGWTFIDYEGHKTHFASGVLYLVYFHMGRASIQQQWDGIGYDEACRKIFWRELRDQGPLAALRFLRR